MAAHVICPFFVFGVCTYDDSCRNSHRYMMCRHVLRGDKCHTAGCRYPHEPPRGVALPSLVLARKAYNMKRTKNEAMHSSLVLSTGPRKVDWPGTALDTVSEAAGVVLTGEASHADSKVVTVDEGEPVDAYVYIDVSNSMASAADPATPGTSRLQASVDAIDKFIQGLRPRDSCALSAFASSIRIIKELTLLGSEAITDARTALHALSTSGNTVLFDAIAHGLHQIRERARSARAAKEARHHSKLIIITDGEDYSSTTPVARLKTVLARAMTKGDVGMIPFLTVYMFAVADAVNNKDLKELVAVGNGRVHLLAAETAADLPKLFKRMHDHIHLKRTIEQTVILRCSGAAAGPADRAIIAAAASNAAGVPRSYAAAAGASSMGGLLNSGRPRRFE